MKNSAVSELITLKLRYESLECEYAVAQGHLRTGPSEAKKKPMTKQAAKLARKIEALKDKRRALAAGLAPVTKPPL